MELLCGVYGGLVIKEKVLRINGGHMAGVICLLDGINV